MAELHGDQERPLSGASYRPASDEEAVTAVKHTKSIRRRRCILCSGCCAASVVIIALIFIILFFTIFKVKHPKITLKNVKITGIDSSWSILNLPSSTTNMTFSSQFTIKNPNYFSFKYNNFTTTLIYYGTNIGEAMVPHGVAKSRRTAYTNVTVNVVVNDVLPETSYFLADLKNGLFNVSTYANIKGRVNVAGIYKKNIKLQSNCSFSYKISTLETVWKLCKSKVSY
ncbi:hypothetical protein ACFE04_017801 [Oxalis oulophora]